jgi:PPK2 family polyphosphate:nucleotide phosphotransferase
VKYVNRFRVAPGSKVKLKDIDPGFKDHHEGHKEAAEEIEHDQTKLRELQELLYAEGRRSLLICLQGMDTGGKDGTINHVLGAMNPQGCRVAGFKQPTALELAHDFLWRVHQPAPAKGEVVIFNRSHYEDVLVVRVHEQITKKECERRYRQINDWERMLTEEGTTILKFFLHISKDEQKKRLEARLADPRKHWKFSYTDVKERGLWDAYAEAFEAMLGNTSTEVAPWYVVPSNRKWYRNLVVARLLVDALEELRMEYPKSTIDVKSIHLD